MPVLQKNGCTKAAVCDTETGGSRKGIGMKTGPVDHIGINTIDLEKSKKFYEEVMHFPYAGEAQLGDDFVTYMQIDEHSAIELFRTDGNLLQCEESGAYAGMKHLAFAVDSVDAWYEHLTKYGCRITLEPTDLEPIHKRVLLFEAPDRVIIELSQSINNETDEK